MHGLPQPRSRRLRAHWSNRGLRSGLVGTADQVAERVGEFEEAGVDLLLLQCSPQLEEMERFAETVICTTAFV
jgi:FMNH2-dependent dimethyl sulfone monooxygenase